MNSSRGLCAMAIVMGLVAGSCQAGDVADYLAQDGTLKHAVTVKTGAVSFLAPPGKAWTIAPSGDWNEKYSGSKGKLGAKQLAALAQHLATQDFNSLPETQGYATKDAEGAPRSGYQFVAIGFGRKQAAFNIKTGETRTDYLPKPGDPKAVEWSRFIALELVFADMLRMSELEEEEVK